MMSVPFDLASASRMCSWPAPYRTGMLGHLMIALPLLTSVLLTSGLLTPPIAHAASDPYLDISWTAPTTWVNGNPLTPATDLVGYSIYYDTTPLIDTIPPCGGTKVDVAGGTTTTYRLIPLTQGTTYNVRVTARATDGSKSLCSPQASGVAQPEFPLYVVKAGNGTGTVTSTSNPSSPNQVNCGSACNQNFRAPTSVTLTAVPGANTALTGWGGDCTGTGACTVTMSQERSVTATFTIQTYPVTVTKAGTGVGNVTSTPTGINCGSTCSTPFLVNSLVTLTATAATGSAFTGWSGDCTGTARCTVTMTQAWNVTATFVPDPTAHTLTVMFGGSSGGSVGSNPSGITCPPVCTASFTYGATVTLSASPNAGGGFMVWRGACTISSPSCSTTTSADRTATAVFRKVYTNDPLVAQSTPIKAVHFTELRDAINTLRSRNGLGAFIWTGTAPAPGGTVRAAHLTDLRTALTPAYHAVNGTDPTYTDSGITAGQTLIKAIHLNELRNYVRGLE